MRLHLASLVIAFVGCATQAPDNSDQLDSPIGKADGSDPSGNYTTASPKLYELTTLTLSSDHTFMRSVEVACEGGGTCPPEVDTGTYLFTHSNTGKRYIRFYNEDGSDLDRYQWKLTSTGKLELELSGGSDWFTMEQGGSCEAAGGSCVALVPDICSLGELGDANEYSCGGGVGVECCLPRQSANACNTDADCSGALPQFCRQCSDGSEACAHWSCASNACEIVTCE